MRQVRTVGDLGAVVRAARRANNWTQAELAAQAGVSRQWVVALESGQAARAELGRVLSVLAVLDLPMTFPSIAPTEQGAKSRPASQAAARSRSADRHAPVAPRTVALQDQPWLNLDAHLASFTTTDQHPGLDDDEPEP